ncbi:signal peptidase I, partial [Parabacteroides sp. AF14-59]
MKKKIHIHKLIDKVINIVFWLCMIVALWFFVQVFVFASFKIPSDSME